MGVSRNRVLEASGVLLAGVIAVGCGGSSGGSIPGVGDGDQGQVMAASSETTASVGSLVLQASLNDNDPVNYSPLLGSIVVTTPAAGMVTLDFGAGVTVNNHTVAGTVTGAYVVAGSTVTVTVTYTNLNIVSSMGGNTTVNGTYTLVATTAGSTATGAISGTVTVDSANDSITVVQNMTYSLDGAGGTITWSGTTSITGQRFGVWNSTYANVVVSTTSPTRQVSAGTITVVRTGLIPVTVVMLFTGINTGDLIVTPPGLTTTFTL